MKKTSLLLIMLLIFGGCASIYKPIEPTTLYYPNMNIGEKFSYGYDFDVLYEAGNSKYAYKEYKNKISVVSIKFINNTDNELFFNKNIKYYQGNNEIFPLESSSVTKKIRQGVIVYLLYGLIALNLYDRSGDTPIPLGLPVGIGNMMVADVNNKKFNKEFVENNLLDKSIKPRETIYGFLAFRDIESGIIEMKLVE